MPPPSPIKKLCHGLLGFLGLGASVAAILALLSAVGFLPPAASGGGSPDLLRRVTFVSHLTGECLGINGAEASGTPLMVRGCDPQNPDPPMEWFLSGNGRIVHRDAGNGWFCMDLPDNVHEDGRQMQVFGCDFPGEAPQQYYQVGQGTIALADGSMCVAVDSASHWCTGDPSQGWDVIDLPMALGSKPPISKPLTLSASSPKSPDGPPTERLFGRLRGLADDLGEHGSPSEFLGTVGKLLGSAGGQLRSISMQASQAA